VRYRPYLRAVDLAFGRGIDYATLTKLYGPADAETHQERKYSPNVCAVSRFALSKAIRLRRDFD